MMIFWIVGVAGFALGLASSFTAQWTAMVIGGAWSMIAFFAPLALWEQLDLDNHLEAVYMFGGIGLASYLFGGYIPSLIRWWRKRKRTKTA